MPVQSDGAGPGIRGIGLGTEDAFALLVQEPLGHELSDRPARLEQRIERQPGFRPLVTAGGQFVNVLLETGIANIHGGRGERLVVIHELAVNLEDVHRFPSCA
ncbi:hypothetical protein [Gordonia sp. WA4-43]|uniref:hypothetical protein n=1 Tax=Gordonia sp. WA4-43 TaxID=2878678 RepID=UPI001CFA6C26|nr:hypothetical protein [Gordonia sp. WA4-43]UCZ92654.1 hypothetical protein LEL84_19900 [Gordonia sp. WA4-43]